MKTYKYRQERITDGQQLTLLDELGHKGWRLVAITEHVPAKKNMAGKILEGASALYTFSMEHEG